MSNESVLQSYIAKNAAKHKVLCYKFSSPSRRGVPDLLLIAPDGRVEFIEVKHPGKTGRLSRLQEIEIAKLTNQNVVVHVCDSREQAAAIVERLANRCPTKRS